MHQCFIQNYEMTWWGYFHQFYLKHCMGRALHSHPGGILNHQAIFQYPLGTHDVQNISMTSPHPGKVRVTGNWIRGSNARGVLVIVYNATNAHYHVLERKHEDHLDANMTVLLGGEYNASVFVMQVNGELCNRAALQPIPVSVTAHPGPSR